MFRNVTPKWIFLLFSQELLGTSLCSECCCMELIRGTDRYYPHIWNPTSEESFGVIKAGSCVLHSVIYNVITHHSRCELEIITLEILGALKIDESKWRTDPQSVVISYGQADVPVSGRETLCSTTRCSGWSAFRRNGLPAGSILGLFEGICFVACRMPPEIFRCVK